MGKVVRTVGKIAGIVAGIAAIGTGIGAVFGGTMVLSILGASVTASALAAGAGLVAGVAGMLAGGQSVPQSETQLGRLQARLDTQAPRKIVLGPTAMPADIRYYEGSGQDDEFIDYIICVAAHRVRSIDQIWFEDELAWSAAGGVQGEYVGYLTAVDTRLEGTAANTIAINGGTRWGSDDRLTGCAYLRLRIKRTGNNDEEQSPLSSGLPGRVTIIGEGMPMYDPRFDSTVGGVGPMRINDQNTWGASSGNLIIQALNVLLGWRINGELSVGAGLPAKYLDIESVITAANICDEDIALSTGGTQARYRGAGAFSTDDAPMNIVGALLAGCAGDLLDSEGRLSFLIKTNSLATPAVTFDDNDVVSGARWDPMGGQTDLPNIISGSFTDPSPNSLYQMVPYPSVKLPSEDGIERSAPLDLAVVENAARAQRLAKQTLQRMQYPGTFTAEYNMKGMAAKVGRIVWQTYSPRGWLNKPFRVVSQRPSRSGRIALVLREEHASIYAWEAEDSAAVQPAEAVRFDPRNAGPILLARKASQTADWPKVSDSAGTKPQDNATEGATIPTPGSPEPGNVRDETGEVWNSGELLNSQMEITPAGRLQYRPFPEAAPVGLGEIALPDLGAASERAVAESRDAIDRLSQSYITLLSEASRTRETFRDAGFFVDPATGTVKIHAAEQTAEQLSEVSIRLNAAEGSINLKASTNYVNEQIAMALFDPSQVADLETVFLRLGSAELDIDALQGALLLKASVLELSDVEGRVTDAEAAIDAQNGVIALKADTATVTALDTRVTSAEQTITAMGDVASIEQSISTVRLLEDRTDANAEANLLAILTSDENRREAIAGIAAARSEITTKLNEDLSLEALRRAELGVRVGAAEGAIVSESLARASMGEVLAQNFDSLMVSLADETAQREAAITALEQAVLGPDGALVQTREDLELQIAGETEARQLAVGEESQLREEADGSLFAGIGQQATIGRGLTREVADAATAGLMALLSGDETRRAALGEIVAARQELTTRITAEGELLASQILALLVQLGDVSADVRSETLARVLDDQALAGTITEVTTRVDETEASITEFSESINGVETRWGVRLDVNGRVTGVVQNNDGVTSDFIIVSDKFLLIDPGADPGDPGIQVFAVADGTVYIFSDLEMGTGRIVMRAGGFMKVQGSGFGTTGQFLEWFGPERAISACDEASASYFLKVNGDAYFGGSLSAGILTNKNSTSSLAADASVEVGPFGTNGNPIVVSYSYQYSTTISEIFPADSTGLAQFDNRVATFNAVDQGGGFYVGSAPAGGDATVILEKGEAQVSTFTVSGGVSQWSGSRPVPAEGISGSASTVTTLSGGATYTDNAGGVADRTFTASLTARSITFSNATQRITIIATEE